MKKHIILYFLSLSLIAYQICGMSPEEWRRKAEAFTMATHPRLGAVSPAQVPPDVRKHILELVRFQEWVARPQNERDQALLNAAQTGDLNLVRFFLDVGADKDAKDHLGNTPLYFAVDGGHESVVIALLAAGANVNVGLFDTPLHRAARQGNLQLVRILLDAGANPLTLDFGDVLPSERATTDETHQLLEEAEKHAWKMQEELR